VNIWAGLARGTAAGAAGTTALNAVTYLDMVARGRPVSSTPERTIEKLSEKARLPVPGTEETRGNRISGLGSLIGLMAGVAVGGALGVARSLGWCPGQVSSSLTATAGALIGSNGPMTLLGVTDPRTWGSADWASDLVPHLAYGVVTAVVLDDLGKL